MIMLRQETKGSVDNEALLWKQVNTKIQKFTFCRENGARFFKSKVLLTKYILLLGLGNMFS